MMKIYDTQDKPFAGHTPFPRSSLKTGMVGWFQSLSLVGGLLCASASSAIDFGPFTLTGYAKIEGSQVANYCNDCALYPSEGKQRFWADELVPGKVYEPAWVHGTQFQPWLAANFDLGRGFKFSGLLSQRWRDGKEDIHGFLYEKNIAVSHEDYGSLRVGDMTTRAWSVADYPYATNIQISPVWSDSGAGYGLNKNAIRYTSRLLDVADGDLVLEATYSRGNTDFKIHKPRFVELYAQYHRGDLVVDAMLQDTRNGNPQAWSHGPFWGPTNNAADDGKIGDSGQSIAMVMARYQATNQLEVTGGLRRNHWTGAYAVLTQAPVYNYLGQLTTPGLWNNMFNVDWGGTLNGVSNPGYPATSYDGMLGLRYRMGKWTPTAGIVHLGTASTANPSERGQSNSATVTSVGAKYDYGHGLELYGSLNLVHYGRLGLSPMSMDGNASFTNVDSRVSQNGAWASIGAVFVF